MSKRLEEEYRKMVESEVPDLWSRIESGLREKTPAPEIKESAKAEEKVQVSPVNGKKKKPVIVKLIPWMGGIAAAAIILVLVLPAVLKTTKNTNKTAKMEMPVYAIDGMNAIAGDAAETQDAAEEVQEENAAPATDEYGKQALAPEGNGQYKGEAGERENEVEDAPVAQEEYTEARFYVWIDEIRKDTDTASGYPLCGIYKSNEKEVLYEQVKEEGRTEEWEVCENGLSLKENTGYLAFEADGLIVLMEELK